MTDTVTDILRRATVLFDRGQFPDYWQELAEVLYPQRANFTTNRTQGANLMDGIYDSSPIRARRALATILQGLMVPKSQPWFDLTTGDDDLDGMDEVREWLGVAERRMRQAIYNPRAKFIQRNQEIANDLVTFGPGALFIGEADDLTSLMFRAFHLRDYAIAENADGIVDTFANRERLTPRQAAQRWGKEKLGAKTLEALKKEPGQGGRDDIFEFVWMVMPRADFDPRRSNSKNMPFASITIDVKSEHTVDESGFMEFPFAIPRWDVTSDERYGRGPGMIALPDAETLQEQGRTNLIAGQRVVDPPIFAASDSLMSAPRTWPGGVTYFDAEAARELGGRLPFEPMQTGANLPVGREMQNDTRLQVQADFFRNVFNLPIDGPQMTATEILERRNEFMREIGPTIGHLEDDWPAVIADRSLMILFRAGQLPPMPDVVKEAGVRPRVASTVNKAQKQIEAVGLSRSLEIVGAVAAAQPEVMDNYDGDKIARDTPEVFDFPTDWLRSKEAVAQLRAQRADFARAQQQAADVEMAAGVADTSADALNKLADAGETRGG